MGIFSSLFGSKKQQSFAVDLGTLGGLAPVFSAFGKNYLESETYLTCVRANASYASKIIVKSVRETEEGKIEDYPEMDYLLQLRPNPTMCAATFWERVRTFYDIYNNSFVYIEKDILDKVVGLWSIDPGMVEFGKAVNGEWLVRFTLDGQQIVAPYSQIIHISRNVINTELWGDDNHAIQRVLNLINTNYQGIENAIKTSAVIRFWGEVTTKMSDAELKKKARTFTKNFLEINPQDPVGIAIVDSVMKINPISHDKQKTANYQEQNNFDQKVFRFCGCPESIVAGNASEAEVTSYITREQEPFFVKIEQEATYKLFTKRELGFKNKIIVQHNKFEHFAPQTRLSYFNAAKELGVATVGQLGEMLGLTVPKEAYSRVLISQNYQGSMKNNPKDSGGEDNKDDKDNTQNNEGKNSNAGTDKK